VNILPTVSTFVFFWEFVCLKGGWRGECLVLTPVILSTWEAEIRRIKVQGQPEQTVHRTPIAKTTSANGAGGVAQVHLHCKREALSSNPSATKKKNKKLPG
jgi:hypothetical protein